MAGKVLSIEISANVTRICLTDYKVKNPKVYKYAKFLTPQGVLADGEVQVGEEFVQLIKNTIAENRMNCKQVVFSITSSRIASREINIPLIKEKQIDTMIRANLSDYFPIDLSLYEVGYTILEKDTVNKNYRIQVLAAPKQLLDSYSQLANACGLQLMAADYSGNSIYQIVKNECKEGVKMVVKVDENSTIVTIIKDQSIALQRTVSYGINDAINAIAQNPAFPANTYEEAIELAFRKTCIKPYINARELIVAEVEDLDEEDALRNAREEVASALDMLVNGVIRTIDYYSSRNGGEAVEQVYITGLGADFSGISKLFTNELGIKTVGIKHLEGHNLERSFTDGRFGEYITCVGAVIAPVGLIGSEKSTKEKAASKESDYTGIAYLLLVGGFLIAIALIGVSTLGLWTAKQENASLTTRLADLSEVQVVYDTYLAAQATEIDVENLYALTETSNERLLEFIAELEEKMPSNIHVTSFQSGLENASMNIEVGSKEEMANAVQQLRSFQSVSSVSVQGVTDDEDESGLRTVTFSVNATYKTQAELAAEEAAASQNE